MDFARKQLEKYGWTDGKGLGKHENGISKALKPKLKRSVTGVGYDAATDFTEHWWTQLYNKAASNVEIEEVKGKTKKIKRKDSGNFEITNSVWQMNRKTKENGEYSENFIRKSILTSGGSKVEKLKESDSEEEIEKKDVFKMTDEELFAACEGRTAHKGARHGLKALGKLARIAQQEQLLLRLPQYKGYSHVENLNKIETSNDGVVEDMNLNSETETLIVKKKKKKRKRCKSRDSAKNDDEAAYNNIPLPTEIVEEKIEVYNVANSKNCKKIKKTAVITGQIDANGVNEKNEMFKRKRKNKEIMSNNGEDTVGVASDIKKTKEVKVK